MGFLKLLSSFFKRSSMESDVSSYKVSLNLGHLFWYTNKKRLYLITHVKSPMTAKRLDQNKQIFSIDQLPISAVLGSVPIPYCTYSTPTFGIPYWSTIGLPVHTSHIPQSPSYFSIFSTVYPTSYQPSTITWLNYPPPNYLGPQSAYYCHHYDFLVTYFGMDLYFFELF